MTGQQQRRCTGEAGTGLIALWAGLLVFLLFLFFAVQLLYGLYATSTVTAVVNDAAQRAAARDAPDASEIEADLRRRLSGIDDRPRVEWSADDCADGRIDLRVVVEPPRFVPDDISEVAGLGTIDRTVHVRCERVR